MACLLSEVMAVVVLCVGFVFVVRAWVMRQSSVKKGWGEFSSRAAMCRKKGQCLSLSLRTRLGCGRGRAWRRARASWAGGSAVTGCRGLDTLHLFGENEKTRDAQGVAHRRLQPLQRLARSLAMVEADMGGTFWRKN